MERNHGQQPGGKPGSKRESSAEILGRYSLLTEIAAGDLTTVHLARQHGDSGFQRLVALRRLKPLFARQPECVQLLLDEARLTSGLHHANVVGCLDMGTEGGCYVVQNYVEGDSLDGLLTSAASERHARYTVPLIVDVLNGLHAVHTALDDDGVPLSLVHQAPRARHILVGIDGIARLTDFTQAKARIVAPTRQRADRLKIADMAPEQALNPEAVDHRADLFLIGVTLWEALTGERLFAADGDENTFQHLLHRRIPRPSEIGLHPPRCFDAICLRALERDPDKRYRSSLDMARELRDVALNHALYATTGEIGQWVKALAGPKLIERRKLSGSESSSQEVHIEALPSSSSGFFQSTTKSTDPYGSGLIFGGSFSRLEQANPMDIDKTPAIGIRTLDKPERAPEAGRKRDDEPTARHTTGRNRKSTEPMWPMDEAQTKARVSLPQSATENPGSGGTARAAASKTLSETLPEAHPGNSPSAAGSAAAPPEGAARPGAYSQVSAPRKRPSSPQPGKSEGSVPARPQESRAPTKPLPATAAARPSLPPSNPAAGAVARPRPKSKAAIDAQSPTDHRNDSTPTRLMVPSGPVGSLYRDASPSKTPRAFEPPSMPRALGDLTGRTQRADVLHVSAVDSLTPPTTAQRTHPPATFEQPSPRSGRAIWVVTGLLAAIILLAAGVSVRNWQNTQAVRRVTASQPRAAVVTPTPPVEATPAPSPAPQALQAASPTAADIPVAQPAPQKPLAGQRLPKGRLAPARVPTASLKRTLTGAQGAAQGADPSLPTLDDRPVRPAKPRPRNPLPIPDNPY